MAKYSGLKEKAIKNKIEQDYFSNYEHADIIGNIDFCVAKKVYDEKSNVKLFVEQEEINSLL